MDYDNDGDRDLIFASFTKELILLINNGIGEFERVVACDSTAGSGHFFGTAETILSVDFNGENKADIALITLADSLYIYQNAGWSATGIYQKNNKPATVDEFILIQNYPNPFNPSTIIKYVLKNKQTVQLKIYDILGREVDVLVNGEQAAGSYDVSFNASGLASGIYFYVLQTNGFVQSKKMILLR